MEGRPHNHGGKILNELGLASAGSTVGFTVRQTMILEFSPTLIPVILAGKVGSAIASQIGTMRVTEQIDALEIMGINSANHLILPKIADRCSNALLISTNCG